MLGLKVDVKHIFAVINELLRYLSGENGEN